MLVEDCYVGARRGVLYYLLGDAAEMSFLSLHELPILRRFGTVVVNVEVIREPFGTSSRVQEPAFEEVGQMGTVMSASRF